jgi:hypothetical protein
MTEPTYQHLDHREQPDGSVVVNHWPILPEAYCVDSGRAVRDEAGDRCIRHGDRGVACTTAVRMPGKCEHRNLSPNHPRPRCSECGLDPLFVEVRS